MSVIVMGYRNAATIVSAVSSVIDQLEPRVEVVVVTSGPESGAAAVRAAFPDVHVVESLDRLQPGGARNLGVRSSTGDVVAFLAADCIAAPGWLRGRLRAHGAGYRAVASAVSCAAPRTPWAVAAWLIGYANRLPGYPAGAVDRRSARRHSLSIDRALLELCGGYDESVQIGEDTIVADRVLGRGETIQFEPAVCIAHHGPRGPWGLIADEFARGRRLRTHQRSSGTIEPRWSLWRRAIVKIRHSLESGWRYGGIGPAFVVGASPFVVVGVVAQLLGAR